VQRRLLPLPGARAVSTASMKLSWASPRSDRLVKLPRALAFAHWTGGTGRRGELSPLCAPLDEFRKGRSLA
jgi:hypothetical protein